MSISCWEAAPGVHHVDGAAGLGMMLKLACQSARAVARADGRQ